MGVSGMAGLRLYLRSNMIQRPRKLPETGKARELARFLNHLVEWSSQFEIQPGTGYKLKKTSKGSVLEIQPGTGTGTTDSSPPVWQ